MALSGWKRPAHGRPAVIAKEAVIVDWIVLAIASGSRIGKEAKMSGLLFVSMLLPEPFAPAMRVKEG